MRKINQQGSVEAVIMAVLVVALIGALGFIFYQNFIKDKQAETSTGNTVVDKDEEDVTKELYKGERISSLGGAYTVKIPNGWVLINNNTADESFGKDFFTTGPGLGAKSDGETGTIVYNESVSPVIKNEQLGGWGGLAEVFSISSTGAPAPESNEKQTDFKLDDGTEGKKLESVVAADPNRDINASDDDFTTYRYLFEKNGKTVQAVYSVFSNNQSKYDQNLIENVVRSIEIK